MSERPTLELSADRVRAEDGAFLIIMPGDSVDYDDLENAWVGDVRRVDLDHTGPESRRILTVPPSVLVALNQPCPNCDGDVVGGPFDSCGGSGRLVFDLKRPCLNDCYPVGSGPCQTCAEYPHGPGGPHRNTGIVSHRVWLDPEWGILPIVDKPSDSQGRPAIAGPCTSDTGERVGFVMPHGSINPTQGGCLGVLPSAARPGDYVARAVKIESTERNPS